LQPDTYIPPSLTSIHGISNEMVADAPRFSDLADTILELLEDRIFVAHNVQFDYGFLEAEFQRANRDFRFKKLCTVRLARRMLKLRSNSLASLCRHFEIINEKAHRALEDAKATAEILTRLMELPGCQPLIQEMTRGRPGTFKGPVNLPEDKWKSLPEETGVYYFTDAQGKVIYVGKAVNLRERVGQHFNAQTHTREKEQFLESIFDLHHEISGHELMALLRENELIKQHYPRFNRLNKDFRLNYGIYRYEDQRGYTRLMVGESGKWSQPLQVFRSRSEAVQMLLKLSIESGLCLHLNGLTSTASPNCSYEGSNGINCISCNGKGIAEYNQAVRTGIEKYFQPGKTILMLKGRTPAESGIIYLEKGKIMGLGFGPAKNLESMDLQEICESLKPYYDTQDAQAILRPWMEQSTIKRVMNNGTTVFFTPDNLPLQRTSLLTKPSAAVL
jgi:DNA polymerase-3 subunit epsilon